MMPMTLTCRTVKRVVGSVCAFGRSSSLDCTIDTNRLYAEAEGRSSSQLWQAKRG